MKVRFLKSPTGQFNLGYHVGDEADIKDKELVKKMLDAEVCELVAKTDESKKEDATSKAKKETR